MSVDKSLFFDPNKILSHNKHINMIVANRGYGKTYGTKKFAINRHLKHGTQFIYIKRHKDDLKNLDNFFDTMRQEFPDNKFEVKGKKFLIDGNPAGEAIPLSQWQKMKSNEYPDVEVIIFDEFIKEKDLSYYLPNEVESFLNLLDTIVRNRDNWWVFMLANAVTMANPYFMYFKLFPKKNQEIYKHGEILVNIPDNKKFAQFRKNTALGKIISGTDYGRFSLENEFKEDGEIFIQKRTPQSKYQCTFSVGTDVGIKHLGLWYDANLNLLFLSPRVNINHKNHIATRPEQMLHANSKVSLSYKDQYYSLKLGKAFLNGELRFDDIYTRSAGYDLLKKLKVQ